MQECREATADRGSRTSAIVRMAVLLMIVVVTGCARRPGPEVLADVHRMARGAQLVTVYVATTRKRKAPGVNVFTATPSNRLNYAVFTVSVPPDHKPGKIEYPEGRADPEKTFATISQRVLGRRTFDKEIVPRDGRRHDVAVFVHGYNTNFEEALFRLVQLTADAKLDTSPILFAWPSEAELTGYLADKEAVTFSRDGLVRLLTGLSRDPGVGRITLFGHSMGAWLTAEALRQLRLTGRNAVIKKLDVILAAPDIDVDVFRSQLKVIGPLLPPMTILVSPDDKALAISRRISSGRPRLGALNVDDPRVQEAARAYDLRIIDISKAKGSNQINHDRYVGLAALYPKLSAAFAARSNQNLRQAGAFVFNTAGTVLSAPFTLAGKALAGE